MTLVQSGPTRQAGCILFAAAALALALFPASPIRAQGLKPRIDDDRAADLVAAARRLIVEGDPATALTRLETVSRRYRKAAAAAEADLLIGQLYLENRELEEAFDAYQRVIDRHAGSPFFPQAIRGQEEAATLALEAHRTAVRRGERSPRPGTPARDTVANMFRLLVRNGRHTPGAPQAQYNLAVALDQLGLPDEAIEEHERFLRDYPEHPHADDAAFQLGNIRFHQSRAGNREEGLLTSALIAFESFLSTHPDSERAAEARARIATLRGWQREKLLEAARQYERLGKREAAALTLARLLQEFPETPDSEAIANRARALSQGSVADFGPTGPPVSEGGGTP